MIILPELNRKDLEEIPLAVRQALDFRFVGRVEEVLALALLPVAESDLQTERRGVSPLFAGAIPLEDQPGVEDRPISKPF